MPHDQNTIKVDAHDDHRFELIDCGEAAHPATLLFVPGLGISARNCIAFGQALNALGVRVLIHEFRGLGSSSLRASRSVNWGYRELIEYDLNAAFAAAYQTASENQSQLYFGGHSLGSQLACISASLQKTPVAGLIILAGGVPSWRHCGWPMNAKLLSVSLTFPALAAAFGYFPGKRIGFGGSEARRVIFDWTATIRSGKYHIAGLTRGGKTAEAETTMAELQSRILALRMQDDHWVSQGAIDALIHKMPRCPAEQHIVGPEQPGQRADHFSWMRSPEPCAKLIKNWIEQS